MRVLAACIASVALSGCASTGRMVGLDDLGEISYGKRAYGYESIDGVKFSLPAAAASPDALPLCIHRVVENRSVNLKSRSNSIGAYTGTVYSIDRSHETGGGQVLDYVSKDGRSAAASGSAAYQQSGLLTPVEQSVRYSLAVQLGESTNTYEFSHVDRAQLDTGSVANDGYSAIGTWNAAKPRDAVLALRSVAERINECLTRQ